MGELFIQIDSAKKKNIQHFTNKKVICIGRYGCNLNCLWCMNKELTWGKRDPLPHTMEDFERILTWKDPKEYIIGFGMNEPSMCSETYRMAGMALEARFQTYISTNGMQLDRRIFSLFHYIDLDIKAGPTLSNEAKELFKNMIGHRNRGITLDYTQYRDRISIFCNEALTLSKHINVTMLCIPEFINFDFINFDEFNSPIPIPGSSLTLRAFHSPKETQGLLSSSDMAYVREIHKKIRPLINKAVAIYEDPCWI